MVPVERPHRRVDVLLALPRLGDGHGDGVADVATGPGEQLDGRVELAGVGVVLVEHGVEKLLGAEAGRLRAEHGPGPHAVGVAGQGVDLAVVAEHPEGLGPLPRRQGVGGEALVEDGERGGEALVGKVEVEGGEGVGDDKALVEDRPERGGGDVGAVGGGVDAPAQPEGGALGGPDVGGQHRLDYPGPGRHGQLAQLVVVGGHGAPVDDPDPLRLGRGLDLGPGVVAPHEEHGHAVGPALVVGAEQLGRDGHEQAGAVAGAGVGGQRAPVLHAGQPVEGGGRRWRGMDGRCCRRRSRYRRRHVRDPSRCLLAGGRDENGGRKDEHPGSRGTAV